jgi:hypothetical protein
MFIRFLSAIMRERGEEGVEISSIKKKAEKAHGANAEKANGVMLRR